ncbi:MAG: ubiquitin-conjugating enzyme E2 [Planctomycetota bacterium]
MTDDRQQRLIAELEALRALKKTSTIFDFEASGEAPDRYMILFRGKGIARDTSADAEIETVELHKVELRLPYSYPERSPDIRWTTPILHPNVSYSGFINLKDIGLPWEDELGLDVVCERLWDVARLAYMNLDNAANYSAKNWFEDDCQIPLPVDPRPLRDKHAPAGSNVIRYQRKGTSGAMAREPRPGQDVFFIGEDTPTPELPKPPRRMPVRRPPPDDSDVLFIGDD